MLVKHKHYLALRQPVIPQMRVSREPGVIGSSLGVGAGPEIVID